MVFPQKEASIYLHTKSLAHQAKTKTQHDNGLVPLHIKILVFTSEAPFAPYMLFAGILIF
ncbi:hypothetical protein CSQ88_02855 [Iodobacter sp. BJB302]|nr:hypothetical protein CSQ88_02855 [Iodobacter sp. BJB302]